MGIMVQNKVARFYGFRCICMLQVTLTLTYSLFMIVHFC